VGTLHILEDRMTKRHIAADRILWRLNLLSWSPFI
jgi:hypothetical protein